MTDHVSEEQISAFVDRQLDPEECRLLEAHLAQCETCRNIFVEMSEVTRLFRLGESRPHADLWRRISTDLNSSRPASWLRRPAWARMEIWATAAAILLIFVVGARLFLQYRSEYTSRQMALQELDRIHTVLTTQYSESYNPFRASSVTDWNSNPFSSARLGEEANPFRPLARQ